MDLTLFEALYILALDQEDTAAHNITMKVRRALVGLQINLLLGDGEEHVLRSQEDVDDMITAATRNGEVALFI